MTAAVIAGAQELRKRNNLTDFNGEVKQEISCEDNEKLVCGDLPVIDLIVDASSINKEDYTIANLYEYYPEGNSDYPYQFDSFRNIVAVKYRGDSSYFLFDKYQYKFEFRNDSDFEDRKNRSLLGMGKSDDWAIHGPFIDTSLMHNKLFYSLSREMFEWAPNSRYFELYINSEYQGIYLAVEYPSADESRIDLNNFSLLSGETPYLVQRNNLGYGDLTVPTFGNESGNTSYPVVLKYPNSVNVTKKQFNYIERDISDFEKKLYADNFDSAKDSYRDYINVESFIDYFIINELAMIKDAGYQSMFMYKDFNGKLTTTVWDFNNALDHYVYMAVPFDQWIVAENNWYEQFLNDRIFVKQLIERYLTLRETTLSDEHLEKLITDYEGLLRTSESRNFEKWGYIYMESLIATREDNPPLNFEQSIQRLKDNLKKRLEFIDQHITDFYVW